LLGVAQFCAVIFVVLSPAVAAEVVFHKTIKEWWTLLRGHHVIICGAHRAGEVLKKEFEGKGHRVLQIDAATDDALNRADVKRAQYLVAVMDDDGDNIAVAQRAREITGKPQQVFVHVARPDLRALLRHQRILQWEEGKPRIRLFDIYENTARLLLRDHYLDYKPIEKNDGRVVQLVVIGSGRMGEAVLTRAVMVGHYANLKPLQVKVVDLQALHKERLFRDRYDQLREICDAEFIASNAEDPSTWHQVAQWCADPKTISTVVIALDQNVLGLSLALSLRKHLDRLHQEEVPIRVRLPEQSNLKDLPGKITAFGSICEACAYENVAGAKLDAMAETAHTIYLKYQDETNSAPSPSRRKWEELDDELQDSNRQMADHISVKLRVLDPDYYIDFGGSGEGKRVTFQKIEELLAEPSTIELLAKMEHQRWRAERLLAGWAQHWERPKDPTERKSSYRVPWEKLDHNIQEIDLHFVRRLPKVVKKAGLTIRQKQPKT
jgi:voltage-gated potassium channel Kch